APRFRRVRVDHPAALRGRPRRHQAALIHSSQNSPERSMNQPKEPIGTDARIAAILPKHRDLYYGGKWQKPAGGYQETLNPATGASLGNCAEANAADVDAAVK